MGILNDSQDDVQPRFTAAEARKRGFLPLPLAALREHGQAAQTLGAMLSVFRQDGSTTFRRQDILAKSAGVPLRTFQRHLATLEAAGLIVRRKRQRDRLSSVLRLGRPESELLEAGFLPLPRYALELPFSERIVYSWIVFRAELSPAGDTCTDTLAVIARGVGLSRRAVGLAIVNLADQGYVQQITEIPGEAATIVLLTPQTGSDKVADRQDKGGAKVAGRPSRGCAEVADNPRKNGGSNRAKVAGQIKETPKEPDKKRLVSDRMLSADEAAEIVTELSRFRGRTWPALQTLGLDASVVITALIARQRGQVSAMLADHAVGLLVRLAAEPKQNPIGWTISELRDFGPDVGAVLQRLLPLAKRSTADLIEAAQKLRIQSEAERPARPHQDALPRLCVDVETVEDPPKRVRQTPPEKAPAARAVADVDAAEIRRRRDKLLSDLAEIE